MKIFINYVHFKRDDAQKLVRNDSNNDYWLTANSYAKQLKDWENNFIIPQQKVIKDYLNYLGTIKRSDEYFVIKIVNDINTKLKACNAKDKDGNYLISRVKQRTAGAIGVDLYDPVLWEIKNLREGLDFPEYPTLRNKLTNWFKDKKATIKEVREIFASYQPGQWETIYDHFNDWNNKREYPIKEINDILDGWNYNKNKVDSEFNQIEIIKSLQIQLKERADNSILFAWRVPLEDIPIYDETKKDEQDKPVVKEYVKNRVLPNILNYLFFLNGEYYEVLKWKQTDWETVEIVAEKSMFYNGYWKVIKTAGSGWVHHSPFGVTEEICNCQPYDCYDMRNIFVCDYELKFDVYRIGKNESKNKSIIGKKGDEFHFISSGLPTKVDNLEREYDNQTSTWTGFKEYFTGMEGILYIFLGKRLNPESTSQFDEYINSLISLDSLVEQILGDPKKSKVWFSETFTPNFKRVGTFNDVNDTSDLTGETHLKFLEEFGLKSDGKMYHPLSQHIKATLTWRGKPVWDGNYWFLHKEFRLTESITPSGNCITVEGSGVILAQVNEFITAKIGGDNQTSSFLSGLISVATTVATAYFTSGTSLAIKGASKAANAALDAGVKSAIGAAGSMAGTALNHSLSYSHTETKESYSIHEFKHKYQHSGKYPLGLRLEWNQQSFNQYLNNSELFGVYRNDTFNVQELGILLNDKGFTKLTISNWRMVGTEYSQWFQSKLAEGVFLEEEYGDTKKIELSKGKIPTSRGGIVRHRWNELTVCKTISVGSGWDDVAHMGGGFWIYKRKSGIENYIRIEEGPYKGTNLLEHVIREVDKKYHFIVSEDSEKWIVKHPNPTFENFRVDIPDQYKHKTLEDGQKAVRIHYLLKFFSEGGQSNPRDEINATHFLVFKQARGNKGIFGIKIEGHHVVVNNSGNPESVPPAGTLPTNPLGSANQTPNPLNIQGVVPPGTNAEIIVTPPTGGGMGEVDINIDTETKTESPPEIKTQTQEETAEEIDIQKQFKKNIDDNVDTENG